MVENILHSQKFERQGNQENIVWGIAAFDHMKTVPQINPAAVQKLPKQRAAVLPQISAGGTRFSWHRVPVDTDSFDRFVLFGETCASRAQDRHLIPVFMKREGLFPDARVRRHGLVFHDDENFSICKAGLVLYISAWRFRQPIGHRCPFVIQSGGFVRGGEPKIGIWISSVHSTIPLHAWPQSRSWSSAGMRLAFPLSFQETLPRKVPLEIELRTTLS